MSRLALVAILCSCASTPSAPNPAPESSSAPTSSDLSGIWYGEVAPPDAHAGAVVVREVAPGSWIAIHRGQQVAMTRWHDWLEARFDAAGLRVRNVDHGLAGYWLQTQLAIAAQPFASPLRLAPTEPGVYRGEARGLRDRLRLYLVLVRQDDGYSVVLRNPERNAGLVWRADHATLHGDQLSFTARGAPSYSAHRTGADTMSAQMGSFSVELTRVPANDPRLAGFHLRPPGVASYRYRVPATTDDGWPATAAADPSALEALVHELAGASCTSNVAGLCPHSVVIAHRGQLVLDEYFAGYNRKTPHDTRSAGKSWATSAIGAAVDRKHLVPAARLRTVLSDYAPFANDDARKQAITVEHLMTMSAGFDCDDNAPDSPGSEDKLNPDDAGTDYARFIVDLPMSRLPGERAVYCSINLYLLSPILEAATGAWSVDVLDQWVLRPLGIEHYHLNLSPDLRAYFGGGIHLRPRDMAKLGQVFLDDGAWRGKQVVSRAWVRAASEPRARINAESVDDYGYGWWVRDYEVGDETVRAVYASGNGGQLIVAVPDRDLVVVFTGGNYMNYGAWRAYLDDLFPRLVLPAFDRASSP